LHTTEEEIEEGEQGHQVKKLSSTRNIYIYIHMYNSGRNRGRGAGAPDEKALLHAKKNG
jgi:hypothetical protein